MLELRQIERALKLKIERLQTDREPAATSTANDPEHASLADPDRFAWRGICVRLATLVAGALISGNLQAQVALRNHS